jgi:hypothetical protein
VRPLRTPWGVRKCDAVHVMEPIRAGEEGFAAGYVGVLDR